MINADQLNFLNVDDNDFDTIDVEPIEDGPEGNRGYLTIPFTGEEEGDEFDCRRYILDNVMEKELQRPSNNINHNNHHT